MIPEESQDYEKTFNEFWAEIVLNPDGSLNVDQIKRELHDYRALLENVPKVYDHITNGRISKPLTPADVVCSVADEEFNKAVELECKEMSTWN